MRGKIITFLRLDAAHKVAIFATVPTLAAVLAGMKFVSLPKLASWLGVRVAEGEPVRSHGTLPAFTAKEKSRIWAAGILSKSLSEEGRCLKRSLVIARALRNRRPIIRIGAARRDGIVHAHAWVEVSGSALDPSVKGGEFAVLRRDSSVRGA